MLSVAARLLSETHGDGRCGGQEITLTDQCPRGRCCDPRRNSGSAERPPASSTRLLYSPPLLALHPAPSSEVSGGPQISLSLQARPIGQRTVLLTFALLPGNTEQLRVGRVRIGGLFLVKVPGVRGARCPGSRAELHPLH